MSSTSLRSGVSRQDPSAQHPTSGDGLTGIKKKKTTHKINPTILDSP